MTEEAVYSLIEDYLRESLQYKEQSIKDEVQNAYYRLGMLALERKIKLKVHCFGKDIPKVIELCQKYGLDFTIDHANGLISYVDPIIKSGCGIILGPIDYAPREDENSFEDDLKAVKLLMDQGIVVCFATDGPGHGQNLLLYSASEAVRSGISEWDAMKAITIN